MRDQLTAPKSTASYSGLSAPVIAFVLATVILGSSLVILAWINWPPADWLRFVFYAVVSAFAAGWKVRLPGVEATLSVNFFFNLLVAVELGFSEAVAVACLGAAVQSWWRPNHRPEPIQIPFNISVLALSSAAAAIAFHADWSRNFGLDLIPRIALAAGAQFCANSLFVSSIIVLTQRTTFLKTFGGMLWSSPYYFVGALGVGLFHRLSLSIGWQSALLSLPAAYLVFRSFQLYLDRLESQRRHAQQMSDLQRRTIEALALAIECKDETTHDHLSRVQIYALEMGKELNLSSDEMEALRAASLLHDIGKLAVPESIINKPGRLTPEEYDKMKIHPGVGAEILSSVQFPYPVVPFVRSHHEKWDGSGYPDGLSGESIPIGARIIAAVDCLDALASDRQYRRALPLAEAMDIVRKDSGRAFDPKIVEILDRRYVEFEAHAKRESSLLPKLSLEVAVKRGGAPGAGFAAEASNQSLTALASAIEETENELESVLRLIRELGQKLEFAELMAVVAVRLRTLVLNDGMAAYQVRDGTLRAVYSLGVDADRFAALHIPFGQGLSGWVAENRKPIVNGNPAVETGYCRNSAEGSSLRSALSVPIEVGNVVMGVMTLHCLGIDAFSADDTRVMVAIAAVIGTVVRYPAESGPAHRSRQIASRVNITEPMGIAT